MNIVKFIRLPMDRRGENNYLIQISTSHGCCSDIMPSITHLELTNGEVWEHIRHYVENTPHLSCMLSSEEKTSYRPCGFELESEGEIVFGETIQDAKFVDLV